ncbi:uncharacterized protein LOC128883910 [Hylaeus volcanicus]|uniref:uncharacterized protein LOC128883910 n=1 Tax=Hylaeus volcanicus TaxID=313075 RepID=UPI0023B7BD70|nr:uncharacterized protein LOC128883910 [Hylaeus volcanicus]
MESTLFFQFKSQVLQKLLLQHETNKDQQTRFFLSYMTYVWKPATEQSFAQYWESCLAVSIETLFTKYVHSLCAFKNSMDNPSLNEDYQAAYLENIKSFNKVDLFGLPFDFLNESYHLNLLSPKETELGDIGKGLTYEEIFKLILQFTLLIPVNKITLNFSLKSFTTELSSLNELNFKCIVRLFLELPYVPSYAFHVLYDFALMNHRLRKITFAILFKYLRSTERPTLKKRTAYQLILHLACAQECDARQDVLTFINRQIINNPSSLAHVHDLNATERRFQDEWSNLQATTVWLEFFAISLLRYIIEEFALVIKNPDTDLYSDASWPILNVTSPNQHLKKMCEHYFRPLIRSQIADVVTQHDSIIGIIQRFGSLLSLLCYHRSHLLNILMSAYGLSTCISPVLAEALQQHFLETLQCIPKEHLSVLIPLINFKDARFTFLYKDILTILVDSVCEQSADLAITVSEIVNVGLLAYKSTQCIQLVVPLLPCLPKLEAEHFFKQCILSSDQQCASLSIERVLHYASRKDTLSKCVSFIPCDRILYILCQSGEEVFDSSSLSFSYILHALDKCVTIARHQSTIFPPPVFLTFLGELVDQFSNSNGRNKLPRIFGYLLVSITKKLPSLHNSILSDIFPFLFKSYSNDSHCNIWNDPTNWEGVCDSILYFWNSTPTNISDDSISNNSKRLIRQILSQLPRLPLKHLLQKTNITLSA